MKKLLIIISLLIIFVPIKAFALEGEEEVTLSNCVDSTSARFILNNEEIKVKFIGIEAGEFIITNELDEINGGSVDEYVCSLLKNAEKIKIEYEPNISEKDKYGRTNAWVFVDDELLESHLVSLGYAKVAFLYDDYKYNEEILEKEKEAKENNLGIWKDKEPIEDRTIEDDIITEEEEKDFFGVIGDFFKGIFNGIVDFFNGIVEDIIK